MTTHRVLALLKAGALAATVCAALAGAHRSWAGLSEVTTISVSNPAGIAADDELGRVYIAQPFLNSIEVVGTLTHQHLDTIAMPATCSGPWMIAIHATNHRLYVSCSAGDDMALLVLDGVTHAEIATIPLNGAPIGVAVNEVTDRVYVATRTDRVAVIDASTNAVLTYVTTTFGSKEVAVNPVTNRFYNVTDDNGRYFVMSDETNGVLATRNLGFANKVLADRSTGKVYVATVDRLQILDGSTNDVVTFIPGHRNGLDIDDVQRSVFASRRDTGDLEQIDADTGAVTQALRMSGYNPTFHLLFSVAVNQSTGFIYVADYWRNLVYVVGQRCTGPAQPDSDGDGYGDGCDCLPGNTFVWGTPSEVQELRFSDKTTMFWMPPIYSGTQTPGYDLLRAGSAGDFVSSASCLETNDSSDTTAVDSGTPDEGGVHFYLVRARSDCPNGQGPLGRNSQGNQRSGAVCN